MRAHIATHALAGSVAAAAATAVAWYLLASMTGFIFHLMPAAPAIAAAWTLRGADPTSSRPRRLAVVAAGTGIGASTLLVLAAMGRPLDDAWLTLGVLVVGALIAARLLPVRDSRPAAAEIERSLA